LKKKKHVGNLFKLSALRKKGFLSKNDSPSHAPPLGSFFKLSALGEKGFFDKMIALAMFPWEEREQLPKKGKWD
jgi:hypothetical protein